MSIQITDDSFVFDLTFVNWFDGGGADALFKNKGIIAVSDEPCDVDAYSEGDVDNISSLRTCLDTGELVCFDR